MLSGLVTQNAETVLSDGISTSLDSCPAFDAAKGGRSASGPRLVGMHGLVGWHFTWIARLWMNWLPVSTASSRKKQWPTVLKVTLFCTRTLLVSCTVTQRL